MIVSHPVIALLLLVFSTVLQQGCRDVSTNAQPQISFNDPVQLRMAHSIEKGDISIIQEMIRNHAVSPNGYGSADKERYISFLTYAVMVRNKDSIRALLEGGADPNFITPGGWSAMAEASRSPDESLLPLLLVAGGDPNLQALDDRPLTFIAYSNQRWGNLNLLFQHGVSVNATDKTGETLLLLMANLNDYEHMLDLLNRGADPSITRGENHVSVAWEVQGQAGRLTPEREKQRQQVVQMLEAKGIHFPVPAPPAYKWDPAQQKFVLVPRDTIAK